MPPTHAVRRFAAGHVFYNRGDTADQAYEIQQGRVDLELQKGPAHVPVKALHPGEGFGRLALIAGTRRHERARAATEVEARIVTGAEVQAELNAMSEFMRHYVKLSTRRAIARIGMVGDLDPRKD